MGSGKSLSDFGTVRFLLANLAFAATRVCVIPSSWCTTEYTTALTPWVDGSPKTHSSNERTGCWCGSMGLRMVILSGVTVPISHHTLG